MNKKKLLTSVAAIATAAAVMLGGTFAWQSISQTALNEASDVINPGGRLHDDFNGENKDIYVENFADEEIYARIQLSEYFEIIANYGAGEGVETSTQLLGSKNDDGTYNYTLFNNYDSLADGTLKAGVNGTYDDTAEEGEAGWAYWSWQTGGSTIYMPTFNMNKDSLKPEINGIYEDGNVGTISDRVLDLDHEDAQYSEYEEYAEGETLTGDEIYDADANDLEDDGITTVSGVEHIAKSTESGSLISMADWDGTAGPYWVYDTDGWVYWAQAIEPDTATGLLLDGIELNQVMDDTWYYAINVVAQFVTADDVGKADGTGFYADGQAPTAEAEDLLRAIGVTSVDDEAGENGGGDVAEPDYTFDLSASAPEKATVVPLGSSIAMNVPVELANPVLSVSLYSVYSTEYFPIVDGEVDISGNKIMNHTSYSGYLTAGEDYTYVNGVLTITNEMCINNIVSFSLSDGPAGQGVTSYSYSIFVVEAAADGGDDEDSGDEYVPFNIVNNKTENKWDNTIYVSAEEFAADGTGTAVSFSTFIGETSDSGYVDEVDWSLEPVDENTYEGTENEEGISQFAVRTTKTMADINDGEQFVFNVTATDTIYPDHPFTSQYTVIIGEAGENATAGVLRITASEGFTASEYEYDDVDINYSIKRAVGDESAYSLTDYTQDAEYAVYAGMGSFDEDTGNTTLDWNTEISNDITVGESGALTLGTLNSGYYKIVATYSDGTTEEVSVSFWKDSLDVSGIGDDNLDVNVTTHDFSITLPEAAAELLTEGDAFTIFVHIWNADTAATGVTVSEPTIEGATYTWTLTFDGTAERNVAYELDITPPAALADYYDTYEEQFVVGSED